MGPTAGRADSVETAPFRGAAAEAAELRCDVTAQLSAVPCRHGMNAEGIPGRATALVDSLTSQTASGEPASWSGRLQRRHFHEF